MQYDSLVFGAEADISYAGINGSTPCPNPDFACQSRINWLGSARLRAGFAFDQVMIYGTGGLGFGNVRMQTVDLVGALGTSGETRTRAGWTLGAGAEFAFADGWSLKGSMFITISAGQTTPCSLPWRPVPGRRSTPARSA